ncbi:hypothetical protein FB451DRAFT_1374666 [Mycena latifolia]|nr:hypothetical protein FB451DRAFT_1374666 [Mycena latifolia]
MFIRSIARRQPGCRSISDLYPTTHPARIRSHAHTEWVLPSTARPHPPLQQLLEDTMMATRIDHRCRVFGAGKRKRSTVVGSEGGKFAENEGMVERNRIPPWGSAGQASVAGILSTYETKVELVEMSKKEIRKRTEPRNDYLPNRASSTGQKMAHRLLPRSQSARPNATGAGEGITRGGREAYLVSCAPSPWRLASGWGVQEVGRRGQISHMRVHVCPRTEYGQFLGANAFTAHTELMGRDGCEAKGCHSRSMASRRHPRLGANDDEQGDKIKRIPMPRTRRVVGPLYPGLLNSTAISSSARGARRPRSQEIPHLHAPVGSGFGLSDDGRGGSRGLESTNMEGPVGFPVPDVLFARGVLTLPRSGRFS